MHPNPIFRKIDKAKNIKFAQNRAFGVLCVGGQSTPALSHIPFNLSDDGTFLEAHIVRSNPIASLLDSKPTATMVVSGDDAYISPDWYENPDQVPTWNYIAVHLTGTLKRLDASLLKGVLDRLSDEREAKLAPKAIWKTSKMTPNVLQKMMRQIIPIAIDVSTIEGTWKLSQNKADEDKQGVIKALEKRTQKTLLDYMK